MKIVAQLQHDQLTSSALMVHDHHHPADPDRQTTVAACVGSIFAQVRHDDRVVAIHADTAFGRLGAPGRPVHDRVAVGPSRAADEHLDTFADVR